MSLRAGPIFERWPVADFMLDPSPFAALAVDSQLVRLFATDAVLVPNVLRGLPKPLNMLVKPFVALPKGPPKDIAPRLNDANPAEAVNATIATLAAFISPVRGLSPCITRSADVAKSL